MLRINQTVKNTDTVTTQSTKPQNYTWKCSKLSQILTVKCLVTLKSAAQIGGKKGARFGLHASEIRQSCWLLHGNRFINSGGRLGYRLYLETKHIFSLL